MFLESAGRRLVPWPSYRWAMYWVIALDSTQKKPNYVNEIFFFDNDCFYKRFIPKSLRSPSSKAGTWPKGCSIQIKRKTFKIRTRFIKMVWSGLTVLIAEQHRWIYLRCGRGKALSCAHRPLARHWRAHSRGFSRVEWGGLSWWKW